MENSQKVKIAIDFIKYVATFLKIQQLPKVYFTVDRDWVLDIRSFGQYNSDKRTLKVYMGNRNLADTLRTLAHELVHHKQNEEGKIQPNSGDTGSEIENEANALAGVILRNYGKKHSIIYEAKINEAVSDYQIYCDMDGVLCDFDKHFEHYFGISHNEYLKDKGEKAFENAVSKAGEEFWETMPWMPGGEELWKTIGPLGAKILSSPGTFSGAKEGKRKWIQKNLDPQPKGIIFKQTGNKHSVLNKVTAKNSVLIDDYSKNINPWEKMGGVGIKHKSSNYSKTISDLENL